MSHFVRSNFLQIRQYLSHPVDEIDTSSTKSAKIKHFIVVFCIDIFVSLIVISLMPTLQKMHLANFEEHKVYDFIKHFPVVYIILLGVFILPALEEVVFRFCLRYNKFYPVRIFLSISKIFQKDASSELEETAKFQWNKNYHFIFYSSAILFGLYHLTNYQFTFKLLIAAPILVFPQFAMGLLTGYLRVKYNFLWGLCLHIMHNAVFLVIPLFLFSGDLEVLNINTKEYTCIISETGFGNVSSHLYTSLDCDSLKIENIELKDIISFILEKKEQLIEYNNGIKSQTTLSMIYSSPNKNRSSNLDNVLSILKKAYKFDVKTSMQNKKTWELQVVDSSILCKFISHDTLNNDSYFNTSDNLIEIKNSRLEDMSNFLSNHFKTFIVPKKTSTIKYNLKFEAKHFNDFRKIATEKFGLQFEHTTIKADITKIRFY